ncbi:segregation and condensation protein A [Thiohalorhabdus sp. Cl-TMA]|uniref:Segregation and condensation protein A n=1 Tax=Thiohalorhabdus methylotrophus TaxID=3242694 RepID=A0ABV4TZF5_9GAMM
MSDSEAVARVHGEPLVQLPDDLYIPPEALEVFLDSFEGPLDLLLYLIRRHRLDISMISIQAVAHQYMQYVELMRQNRLDLAGEYLVMAATLAEMKSRILLPRPPSDEEDEEKDPRTELIRRLQEYERFKEAAEALDRLPRRERDFFVARAPVDPEAEAPRAEASLLYLLEAFQGVLQRGQLHKEHEVGPQGLTVRQRMSEVLARLEGATAYRFTELLDDHEGREGLVVTFLALLELAKGQMIELVQVEALHPLYIRVP